MRTWISAERTLRSRTGGGTAHPSPPGDVTVQDLWQMIPTNPEVFTVEMSGQEILDKLEDSLESVYAADPYRQRGGYVTLR